MLAFVSISVPEIPIERCRIELTIKCKNVLVSAGDFAYDGLAFCRKVMSVRRLSSEEEKNYIVRLQITAYCGNVEFENEIMLYAPSGYMRAEIEIDKMYVIGNWWTSGVISKVVRLGSPRPGHYHVEYWKRMSKKRSWKQNE
ncbi:hypothetical protein LCGC14_2932120 [marine sediment metagenome]|uniref:Uncharacterized protein n=1 Tax=marine sediment metagenome TaxID=412755 RepID=A0A0F8ZT93_9ZZZZ